VKELFFFFFCLGEGAQRALSRRSFGEGGRMMDLLLIPFFKRGISYCALLTDFYLFSISSCPYK